MLILMNRYGEKRLLPEITIAFLFAFAGIPYSLLE